MKKHWLWLGLFLLVAIVLAGCSGQSSTSSSNTEPVKINLTTNPTKPAAGENEIILEVQDLQGKPLTGAKVDVSAEHTDMSGMSMGGAATEQSGGKYAITADFSMSGNWKVVVYVRKDSIDFKKEFKLNLP